MNGEAENAKRDVVVCLGINCHRNGSPELLEQLRQLLAHDETLQIKRYLCFGACDVGPNMVVMPDRLWYSLATPELMENIAAAMQEGKELPGLANHVRPMIRDAVLKMLEAKRDQLES